MALPRNPAEKAFGHSADLMGYAALSDANRAWLAASAVSERKAKRRSLRNGLAVAACSGLLVVMAAPSTVNAATFTWANSNVNGATPAASLNWFNATQGTWTGGTPVTTNNTTVIKFFQDATTALTNTGASGNTQASVIDNGGTAVQLGTLTLSGKASATTGANLTMNISGDALNFSAATGTINLDAVNATRTITYNLNSAIQLGTASSASDLTFQGAGSAAFNVNGNITELQSGSGSSVTKSGNSSLALAGKLSFSGGLTMNAGTLSLSNSTNDYTGGTTVNGGKIDSIVAGSFGSSSSDITIAGASTLEANYASYPTIANKLIVNAALTMSGGTQYFGITFSNVLSGNGSISLAAGNGANGGVPNLGFTNSANTFTGSLTVTGTTPLIRVNSLGDSANFIRLGPGVIFELGAGTASSLLFANRPIQLSGALGTTTIQNNNATASNIISISQNLGYSSVTGNKTLVLGGSNTGANLFAGNLVNPTGFTLAVTKSGGGIWTLSGTNTYSGTTGFNGVQNGGTLIFSGAASASVNTTFRLSEGSTLGLRDDTAGTVTFGAPLQVDLTSQQTSARATSTINVNRITSGSNSTLAIGKLNYAGITDNRAVGATVNVTGGNGYNLQFSGIDLDWGINGSQNLNPTTASVIVTGTVRHTSGRVLTGTTVEGQALTTAGMTFTLDGTSTGNLISGAITNALDYPSNANALPLILTKSNTSIWTLSGTSTYSGTTSVAGGTLIGTSADRSFGTNLSGITIAAAGTLSLRNDSSVSFTNGTSAYNIANSASGATINVDRVTGTGSNTITVGNLTTSSASATWGLNFTGANGVSLSAGTLSTPVSTIAATHTITNNIAGGGSLTLGSVFDQATTVANPILVFAGTGNTTVTGAITQTQASMVLTKNGAGTLTLNGTNTYTGATTINLGVVEAAVLDNGGSDSSIGKSSNAATSLVFGAPTATLRYTGVSNVTTDRSFTLSSGAGGGGATIESSGAGTLSFNNTVIIARGTNNQTRTITLGGTNTGANTFGKVIIDNGTGATSLVKAGSGSWVLDQVNTYTGASTVNGGRLLVNGSTATGSAVTVNNTATLGGNGTVNGAVTVATGGTLRAGDGSAAADDLALNGNLTLNDGSFIELVLGDSGAHSTLTRTGGGTWAFDADQAFKVIPGGYPIPNTQVYDNVITGLTGSEAGLASIGTWNIVTSQWAGTFSYDSLNHAVDLNVTATPEPTSLTLLGLGGMGLLKRRRRSSLTKAAV